MLCYFVIFCRHAAVGSPSHSRFGILPSDFCLSDLSPLPPIRSALFCAMEPPQPLSHQSFTHSFPCNGGGRVSSWAPVASHAQFTPSHVPLFSTAYTLPNSQTLCFDNVATVTGDVGVSSEFRPRRVAVAGTLLPTVSCQLSTVSVISWRGACRRCRRRSPRRRGSCRRGGFRRGRIRREGAARRG